MPLMIKIRVGLLENYEFTLLSDKNKWRMLAAAIKGERNDISPFVIAFERRDRPPGREWAAIRKRIFARDNYICSYCGIRGGRLECDHVVPVAKGGRHSDGNLVTACFPCN